MLAPWVMDEMQTADLDDKRLDVRLKAVLSALAQHPTASIPAACGGRTEMVAAYRFFENEKATFADILQPHSDATRQRIAAQRVVVLAQDTTEIDLTRPAQQVFGAGPLDGESRRGAFLHPLHAFTPDGTPLGTVHATAWTREEGTCCASLTRAQRAAIPIEQKESYRWVTTLRRAEEEARHCPATQFITVSDSEADIYEFLVEANGGPPNSDWIVRRVRTVRCRAMTLHRVEKRCCGPGFLRLPCCFKTRSQSVGEQRKWPARRAAGASCATRARPKSQSVRLE